MNYAQALEVDDNIVVYLKSGAVFEGAVSRMIDSGPDQRVESILVLHTTQAAPSEQPNKLKLIRRSFYIDMEQVAAFIKVEEIGSQVRGSD